MSPNYPNTIRIGIYKEKVFLLQVNCKTYDIGDMICKKNVIFWLITPQDSFPLRFSPS